MPLADSNPRKTPRDASQFETMLAKFPDPELEGNRIFGLVAVMMIAHELEELFALLGSPRPLVRELAERF